MAFRIAEQGYEPKAIAIRTRLGLPAMASVQVCPIHGVVHQTKRCPRPTFEERVESFDTWRAANMGKLLAIVAWAETPKSERVWPPR